MKYKDDSIKFSLTKNEKKKIKERAKKMNMSMSEYILFCVRDKDERKYEFYEVDKGGFGNCDYGIFDFFTIEEMVREYKLEEKKDVDDEHKRQVTYYARSISDDEEIEF